MGPARLELEFVRGDDAEVWFQITLDDAANTPVPLTGYAAKLVVVNAANVAVLSVDTATAGELTVTAATGVISGTLPRAKTALVPVGQYYWGLVTRDAANLKRHEVVGPLVCTRPAEAP